MAGRQTRGRQRIPIRRIENQDDLYATFSKRRLGLYKKASELCTLTGADVGIVIFSPTDNPYSFFHPSMESVLDRYRNPDQPPSDYARIVEAHARARIDDLNRKLDEGQETKEELKEREKYLDEVDKTRPKGWWEQTPIENLTKEQVKEWRTWFQDLHDRVRARIGELKGGGSSSAVAGQLQTVPNFPDPHAAGPSTFHQSYDLPGPSSHAPPGGMIGEAADQFPSQYYNVPPVQGQEHPLGGSGMGQFPAPYYGLPGPSSQVPVPSGSGGSGHAPGPYYLLPGPSTQIPDSSGAGGRGHIPGPYYLLSGPSSEGLRDPTAGRAAGIADPSAGQYSYFPPWGPEPPTGGGGASGSGQAGPSHRWNDS